MVTQPFLFFCRSLHFHRPQVFLYWCSISFYNFFGLSVANEFSSVHRTLIDASRTVFVWGIDLLIYYKIDSCVIHCLTRTFFCCPRSTVCDSDYGETWTKYSPMQARQWRCCHSAPIVLIF